ncbi:diguanylate cyclase response regulator [Geotalea uraniireducens]|uniref:diguanylate cyclase n=1 Tax=Geotalea uraniireducens TaxID=351604 RepID=A0ABM8ELK9_9BACT|nr:diguanylate cyclase [Geotalea uraniireducens]BDV43329.1 diguanylate cyclase response regulator [Geotalea uraniireducens]
MTTDNDRSDTFPYPILIAEDSGFLRKVLEGNLREIGYDVVATENGRQALESFSGGHYPIVVTDLVMPEMDGLQLCREIRALPRDHYTYIILLTAQDSKESIIAGLAAGADEYLIKPVESAELTVRLKTARRILELEANLKGSLEEIKRLSMRDPLTGVYNRRYLDDRFPQEVKRAFRYEHRISVILMDIDHFKLVNDTYGHHAGDMVLRACAACIGGCIRENIDWQARYGGEEFVIVLPETDLSGALVAAERLRQQIAALVTTVRGEELKVTASFGVASFTPPDQQEDLEVAEFLLAQADHCLYQAKGEGRNRVRGRQLDVSGSCGDGQAAP